MYDLPKFEFNFNDFKKGFAKYLKGKSFRRISYVIIFAAVILSVGGFVAYKYFPDQTQFFIQKIKLPDILKRVEQEKKEEQSAGYVSDISYEQAIINVVKSANDSVVSIVISKNMPVYEQQYVNPFGNSNPFFNIQIPQYVQNGTEYKEVGSGSGFVVSDDGLILTNKHVVSDADADYTVIMNDGQKYSAEVLAKDPVQDLAIIKIKDLGDKTLTSLVLGNSSGIQIGQSVVAIGNALGEFSNTVSVGIVSGLSRTISAAENDGSNSETLEDIIQTDAAINSGNSGGPLMNLKGEVIGINTAIAQNAENIAFAIPINYAKKDIDQVKATSKISYPFLGVRYILINEDVKKQYNLSIDYGAYVSAGTTDQSAITAGSPAEKAGIKSGDIILEFNGEKITAINTLAKIIQKYNVGDSVTLKILRDSLEIEVSVTLAERTE